MKPWVGGVILFIAVPAGAAYLWGYPLLLYGLNVGSVIISSLLLMCVLKWRIRFKYITEYGYFLAWLFAVLLSYLANNYPDHNIDLIVLSIYTDIDESFLWLIGLITCLLTGVINLFIWDTLDLNTRYPKTL